ncbi:hypothetical protein [Streptomyces canus]
MADETTEFVVTMMSARRELPEWEFMRGIAERHLNEAPALVAAV